MLAVHRDVMLVILDPETPGGLRLSIDCRYASSSATADDMVEVICHYWLRWSCDSKVRSCG
jgi:hypothetical protein